MEEKILISVPTRAEGFFHEYMDKRYPDVDFGFAGSGAHTSGEGASWVGEYRQYEIADREIANDVHWAIEHYMVEAS